MQNLVVCTLSLDRVQPLHNRGKSVEGFSSHVSYGFKIRGANRYVEYRGSPKGEVSYGPGKERVR